MGDIMSLRIGNIDINKIFLGSNEVSKIYLGNTLIFNKNTNNLYDYSTAIVLTAYIWIGTDNNSISWGDRDRTTYLSVNPNTTYKITKLAGERFAVGTTTTEPEYWCSLTQVVENQNGSEITITTGENDNYLAIHYWVSSETITEEEMRKSIVVTKVFIRKE